MSEAKTGKTSNSKVNQPKIDAKATTKKVANTAAGTIMAILTGMGQISAQQQKLREEETVAHMRGQRHNSDFCELCKVGN